MPERLQARTLPVKVSCPDAYVAAHELARFDARVAETRQRYPDRHPLIADAEARRDRVVGWVDGYLGGRR